MSWSCLDVNQPRGFFGVSIKYWGFKVARNVAEEESNSTSTALRATSFILWTQSVTPLAITWCFHTINLIILVYRWLELGNIFLFYSLMFCCRKNWYVWQPSKTLLRTTVALCVCDYYILIYFFVFQDMILQSCTLSYAILIKQKKLSRLHWSLKKVKTTICDVMNNSIYTSDGRTDGRTVGERVSN